MKTILYMTLSTDGFIATQNDETPWSDASWESFGAFVKTCDAVLLGRRTYEIMKAQDEFVAGPEYIVVTHDTDFKADGLRTITINGRPDLPVVAKLGVIGGGELNGSLASLGLLDEIVLDVEPIILGNGKRLFGDSFDMQLQLKLLNTHVLGEATIQNHYEVTGL